jgi:hypothetical protein
MSDYFDEAYLREPDAYDKRLAAGQVTAAEVAAVSKFHSLAECYESPSGDDGNSEAILRDLSGKRWWPPQTERRSSSCSFSPTTLRGRRSPLRFTDGSWLTLS